MWRGARPSRITLDSAKTLIRPVAIGGHCSVNGISTGKPSAQPLPPEITGQPYRRVPDSFEVRLRSPFRQSSLKRGAGRLYRLR